MSDEGPPIAVPLTVGADDVHAHAPHTGHHWLDLTIALSAIAISVISLFVAVEHGRTERELVTANSWPFLVYASEYDEVGTGNAKIVMKLQNQGVGPARVQSLSMTLDGRPVASRAALLDACCHVTPGPPAQQVQQGLFAQNSVLGVLPARSDVVFLAWQQRPGNKAVMQALNSVRKRLRFKACYCSVLGECWNSDLTRTAVPRPVDACPIGRDPFD